jgi:signal transduction histidine kinase
VAAGDGAAVLQVADDGKGFSAERQTQARAEEHLGLQLLSDLAHDANGSFDVTTAPGEGTRIRLQVPIQ